MGLLSDFTAYVDSLKRTAGNALRETVNDPVGLLQMRLNQVAQQLPAYPGKESVMPGVEGGGLLSRPNVVDWGQAVAMNANQPMGLLGHTVYHGSPHLFDKFDASKIGTGEGAQAYGHGLYFAENPNVAKSYASALGKEYIRVDQRKISPEELSKMPSAQRAAYSAASHMGVDDALKVVRDQIERGNANAADPFWRRYVDELEGLRGKELGREVQSNTYAVDLPDEWLPKMLDWDKPIKETPALGGRRAENAILGEATVRGAEMPSRSSAHQVQPPALADLGLDENSTGADLLLALARKQGETAGDRISAFTGEYVGSAPAAVSDYLRRLGIPGIRYLDGSSRKSGEGTYNYVVFPGMEGLLKIISRE